MNVIALTNIGQLITNCHEPNEPEAPATNLGDLACLSDAAVVVDCTDASDATILWAGPQRALDTQGKQAVNESTRSGGRVNLRTFDCSGRTVIPGFVDSHTHLLFAGERSDEFEARCRGVAYDGGGIMRTVQATRAASDEVLLRNARRQVRQARAQGTTTVEIKTGYGLDVITETRLIKLASQLTKETTFLGAHVVPSEYMPDEHGFQARLGDRGDYVRLVSTRMMDSVVNTGCAAWVDVFCEPHTPHAFDGDETREILTHAKGRGFPIRLHGAQLGYGPGPTIACEFDAASVDHCTFLTDDDLEALAATWQSDTPGEVDHRGTVATFLPSVEFSTKQPYPDMQRAILAGVHVAIATDCNPGTSFSNSMPFAIAIAVREMGLSPAQALWSATAGGASALRRNDIGVVRNHARADLAVIDAPNYVHLAYRPGVPLTHTIEWGDLWTTS